MVKNNPKAFFAYTKSLQKSNCLPLVMKYKNRITDNMRETTELFAEYFSNVYNTTSTLFSMRCNNNCKNYFTIDEDEIRSTILSLDRNKVHSPDGIPTIFYKNTIQQITKPLLIIFKLALDQMKYPDKWKISHLTPIHKSGDTSNVENYHPISVLSAIAKIFDKILHNHIRTKMM